MPQCGRTTFFSWTTPIPRESKKAARLGWGTLVAAELIASTRGIGDMIMSASNFSATDVVVGIAVIAAFAFVFF